MRTIPCAVIAVLCAQLAWGFTIATGPTAGSYFQIAQDIKNVGQKEGIELQVMATKGSFENIQLLGGGKVDLAIVQLDALRFVSELTVIPSGGARSSAPTFLPAATHRRIKSFRVTTSSKVAAIES